MISISRLYITAVAKLDVDGKLLHASNNDIESDYVKHNNNSIIVGLR